MNLSDEIRQQIEKNKGLKLAVGEINNHLSILEELVRKDIMEQVDEAYQKGLEEGKKAFDLLESERNSEYQHGLDAWEAARKIVEMWETIDDDDLLEIFGLTAKIGESTIGTLFEKQTASEAIEKLKAYEKKQSDMIKVGDEVINILTKTKGILLEPETKHLLATVIIPSQRWRTFNASHVNLTKTGKHYDIEKLLLEVMQHD